MRMPESAGPGAAQLVGAQIPALDDFQRCEKFAAEIAGAPAMAGQRGERRRQIIPGLHLAVIAFDAPDRDDGMPSTPKRRSTASSVRLCCLSSARPSSTLVSSAAREIIPDRCLEFRLLFFASSTLGSPATPPSVESNTSPEMPCAIACCRRPARQPRRSSAVAGTAANNRPRRAQPRQGARKPPSGKAEPSA